MKIGFISTRNYESLEIYKDCCKKYEILFAMITSVEETSDVCITVSQVIALLTTKIWS